MTTSDPLRNVPSVLIAQSATIAKLLRNDAPGVGGSTVRRAVTCDLPSCVSGFGGWERWAYDPSVWRYEIRVRCTHGFRLHLGFDPDVTADAIDTAIREIARRMLRRHNR